MGFLMAIYICIDGVSGLLLLFKHGPVFPGKNLLILQFIAIVNAGDLAVLKKKKKLFACVCVFREEKKNLGISFRDIDAVHTQREKAEGCNAECAE